MCFDPLRFIQWFNDLVGLRWAARLFGVLPPILPFRFFRGRRVRSRANHRSQGKSCARTIFSVASNGRLDFEGLTLMGLGTWHRCPRAWAPGTGAQDSTNYVHSALCTQLNCGQSVLCAWAPGTGAQAVRSPTAHS